MCKNCKIFSVEVLILNFFLTLFIYKIFIFHNPKTIFRALKFEFGQTINLMKKTANKNIFFNFFSNSHIFFKGNVSLNVFFPLI